MSQPSQGHSCPAVSKVTNVSTIPITTSHQMNFPPCKTKVTPVPCVPNIPDTLYKRTMPWQNLAERQPTPSRKKQPSQERSVWSYKYKVEVRLRVAIKHHPLQSLQLLQSQRPDEGEVCVRIAMMEMILFVSPKPHLTPPQGPFYGYPGRKVWLTLMPIGYPGAFTRRFLGNAASSPVMLSAAKNLSPGSTEILRCAQHDTSHLASSFPKNLPLKGTLGRGQCPHLPYFCLPFRLCEHYVIYFTKATKTRFLVRVLYFSLVETFVVMWDFRCQYYLFVAVCVKLCILQQIFANYRIF
jgi:hypothetical protein